MKRSGSRWALILFVIPCLGLALQACAPKTPEQQADCGFVQNVYGQRISWKNAVPVQLYLHQSFPDSAIPALENAIRVWEIRLGRSLFKISNGPKIQGPATPKQDGKNVLYWMNTWEAEKASEQARTSVYWVSNEIQEADMRLNDQNFDFYIDMASSNKDVHLESLFVHELGHVLGLKHKDSGDSVMATYLASLTERNDLAETDIEDIRCEY